SCHVLSVGFVPSSEEVQIPAPETTAASPGPVSIRMLPLHRVAEPEIVLRAELAVRSVGNEIVPVELRMGVLLFLLTLDELDRPRWPTLSGPPQPSVPHSCQLFRFTSSDSQFSGKVHLSSLNSFAFSWLEKWMIQLASCCIR